LLEVADLDDDNDEEEDVGRTPTPSRSSPSVTRKHTVVVKPLVTSPDSD
jgi:hypothetical protein